MPLLVPVDGGRGGCTWLADAPSSLQRPPDGLVSNSATVITMLSTTHFKRAVGIAALIGCLSCPDCALGTTGKNLTGTVRDAHHRPLNGAVVKVENQTTEMIRSYITTTDGRYVFRGLNANVDFLVWASLRGIIPTRRP
jgi:hypothetical protein